ncbi:Selenocysteine-specific elongation factor [Trichoplax sp. H2]|nr:Selenocysteine-specific elongation factor [Trichoplax sp. H2]|eukprot:RDD39170.1 Selenocysteine-specific elongation factor [Trichoplax sp. H2]
MNQVLNFNVGLLGHVDSGKTSLAKALSTTASTASFDKNPQSQERGITLDLGFSSFAVPIPKHLEGKGYETLQFTLVDCPGHASLIKTVIGGAQIIDLMILVIDITKGIQTQTAECLIIGEITCDKMLIVLNKIDLLKPESKLQQIEKMSKRLRKTLQNTKFAEAPMVSVAAVPGGAEVGQNQSEGIQTLIDFLMNLTYIPTRSEDGDFIFAVDHCFSIRGQGTVMTGTVLSGSIGINDTIEIPELKIQKKVKSMQIFKKAVSKAKQGDRVGICVTQFDPKQLERGLLCTPKSIVAINACVVALQRIKYFKSSCESKSKIHVTAGHHTILGRATFFSLPKSSSAETALDRINFDFDREYLYESDLPSNDSSDTPAKDYFALIEFEKAVSYPHNTIIIGSRLDTDIHIH